MYLAFVEIIQFRGIKRLGMALSPITAVVGENNFGKTSLLNALLLSLGIGTEGPALDFDDEDFHIDGAEQANRLSIELTFRERERDEWSARPFERLTHAMTPFDASLRQIRCRIVARRSPVGGRPAVEVTFRNVVGSEMRVDDPPSLLADLRRFVPVVVLRSTRFLTRRPGKFLSAADEAWDGDPVHERLEEGVLEIYRSLALGDVIRRDEFERAVASMGRLVGSIASRLGQLSPADEKMAADLRGLPARFEAPTDVSPRPLKAGFGSQSVAVLALLGALLESRGALQISPDATPIIAVEDPEAHHHPVMLASIWRLIDRLPAQKVLTSNSGDLLALVPIRSIRRLVRRPDRVEVHRIGRSSLSQDDLRRIGYHVRANRASSLFARCWLLVEGESEFHLIPELARQLGYDFAAEGIRCIEFAQCGLPPLLRVALDLGIDWHVVTDGDEAGASYASMARSVLTERDRPEDRLTELPSRNIETFMWHAGYADVYRTAAEMHDPQQRRRREDPRFVIERAVDNVRKPRLAVLAAEAVDGRGPDGVPRELRRAIEACVRLARQGDAPKA